MGIRFALDRGRPLMNTQTGVIGRIEELEADELVFDRVPGMPLLGFFLGSAFGLAIWLAVGWVAWRLMV